MLIFRAEYSANQSDVGNLSDLGQVALCASLLAKQEWRTAQWNYDFVRTDAGILGELLLN
jgi:hypothetical protein